MQSAGHLLLALVDALDLRLKLLLVVLEPLDPVFSIDLVLLELQELMLDARYVGWVGDLLEALVDPA